MFESMSPFTARRIVHAFRQDLMAEPKHPAPETAASAPEPGARPSRFTLLRNLLAGTVKGAAKHEGHAGFAGR